MKSNWKAFAVVMTFLVILYVVFGVGRKTEEPVSQDGQTEIQQ